MSGLSGAPGAGNGGEVELRVGEVAREVLLLLSSGVGRADMKEANGGRGRWTGLRALQTLSDRRGGGQEGDQDLRGVCRPHGARGEGVAYSSS